MEEKKQIENGQLTKVYHTNHIVEAITVEKRCTGIARYRKVSRQGYVNLETGEYIESKARASPIDMEKRFKKSCHELRRIINLNFTGHCSEKFLTLIYSNVMRDYKQVNLDFKRFWSRFRYSYPSCEYIRIIEPQGNGSYHLHVLMKRMDKQDLFVPMKKLKQMWEYGGAWIENLPFVENFGAYLCPKFLKESTTPADTVSKAYEKGTRVAFYPEHFRLYSCSRGIQKPVPVTMTYEKLKEIVGETPPCYSHTTTIRDEQGSGEILNSITYEQYILKGEKRHE